MTIATVTGRAYAVRVVTPPRTKKSPHPKFDLAPLQGIDPAAIDVSKPLGRLMLVIALAHNDLKGLMIFFQQLGGTDAQAAVEGPDGDLASKGQYVGLVQQLARLMAGVIHELMVELGEQSAVLESAEFDAIVRRVTRQARDAWKIVSTVALGKPSGPSKNEARELLVRLRNNVAFHYGPKILSRGYQAHFSSKPPKPHSSRAVFSDGQTMEATRFYFADAAAEQGMALSTGAGLPVREIAARIGKLAEHLNLAIKPLVVEYLRSVGQPIPYKPQA